MWPSWSVSPSVVERRDEETGEARRVRFLTVARGGDDDASLGGQRFDELTARARHVQKNDASRRQRGKQLVVIRRRKIGPDEIELRFFAVERVAN